MYYTSCCVVVYDDWCVVIFFFKQKTAYEMRISDWSSYVCSSDLRRRSTATAALRTWVAWAAWVAWASKPGRQRPIRRSRAAASPRPFFLAGHELSSRAPPITRSGNPRLIDLAKVTALIEEIAAEDVLPRFQALAAHALHEKAAGEVVPVVAVAVAKRP